MTIAEKVKNLLTELIEMIDNGSQRDLDRADEIGTSIIKLFEQEPKWIPVSERLPEKNMACLVSVGKLYLTQIAIYSDLMGTIDHRIFYQGDYGHRNFEDITEYVKAWMPLPKPYKPQERSTDDWSIKDVADTFKKHGLISEQEPKTGHCKDCRYFEYDSVAKVDGIPLIVAHEICSRWGDGCKTKEDGYCFLFEPQERSE